MKKIFNSFLALTLLFVFSCSEQLDEQFSNPNEPAVSELNATSLLNKLQADFADYFSLASDPGMQVTRMIAMTGGDTYELAFTPQSFDGTWSRAYQDVLNQSKTLREYAKPLGFYTHTGIAEVLEAYTLMTLVDLFGNVPYSEALQGAGNFNPNEDPGNVVYDQALALLDSAIVNFGRTSSANAPQIRDIYYGTAISTNVTNWGALARTLKLRAWMNLRLTKPALAATNITTLLGQNIIDSNTAGTFGLATEDFAYKYGSSDIPARSRSPLYQDTYRPQLGNVGVYQSNSYMQKMFIGRGVQDPRWRYYFFRQVNAIGSALALDPDALPCVVTPTPSHYPSGEAFCAVDPGFLGRDHGNGDGIPPDNFVRTAYGVYPAGGRLDDGTTNTAAFQWRRTQQGQGANGAGIEPIWMSFFTDFLKAEAELTINGNAGAARTALAAGISNSINRVRSFVNSKGFSLAAEPSQTAYETAALAAYDAATTDDQRLNVIADEYFKALFGNGIEAYNLYRRTGKPGNLQPTRALNGGKFYRSFIYPAVYANLNGNAEQKVDNAVAVFWDNNPATLTK